MKIGKTLIPIAVVLLFLGLALAPGVSAQTTDKENTLTIYMPGITKDPYKKQIQVDQEDKEELENALNDFLDIAEAAMDDSSPMGRIITKEEWEPIKTSVKAVIDLVKALVNDFPNVDTDLLVEETVAGLVLPINLPYLRASIFSFGRGIAWIPFYDYEGFIGMMLRPMFITHTLGFTAVIHFNPLPIRFEYADRLGVYRYRTWAFTGLFINFGDILFDNIIGPVLCIGRGFNHLGEDFP